MDRLTSFMAQENTIVEKTTIVKNNETLKMKANPFAKGYRMEVSLAINPDNSVDLDKILLPLESSVVRKAVKGFADFIQSPIEDGGLGGKLITDDE